MPAEKHRSKAPPAATAGSVARPVAGDPRAAARLRFLSTCRVFDALSAEELERLAVRCVYRQLDRHTALTQHGGEVDALIVVGRGRLKVTLPSPDGKGEFLVGTFVPGDVIGEIGLFENVPR